MNIVFVPCSVYFHFSFYTITTTKFQNEVYFAEEKLYEVLLIEFNLGHVSSNEFS